MKVKISSIVLKDFTLEDFGRLKNIVEHYTLRMSSKNCERFSFIRKAIDKAELKLPVTLKLTKEEFRLLVVLVDISSTSSIVSGVQSLYSFDVVHSLFNRLEQKFIRIYHENVYADADIGVSTLKKSEPLFGEVHVGSNPTIGAHSSTQTYKKKNNE